VEAIRVGIGEAGLRRVACAEKVRVGKGGGTRGRERRIDRSVGRVMEVAVTSAITVTIVTTVITVTTVTAVINVTIVIITITTI
jgi:hypothetical protein